MTPDRLQEEQTMDLTPIVEWIIHTPSLFLADPPIEPHSPFSALSTPQPTNHPQHQRLGFLYQSLCSTLFIDSTAYNLITEEIQLTNAGKTLGAIDFIVENKEMSRLEHWEVAVKFYLLHQGTWFGPNAKDRLDRKLHHMLTHQLPLSTHPLFLQQYPQWEIASHHLLMQGRLYINPFQPESIPERCLDHPLNTSRIKGRWCYQSQCHQIKEPLYQLERHQWMTGHTTNRRHDMTTHDRAIHCQSERGTFWFIVPDHWPAEKP
jgi:hypothetical protein